MRYIVPAFVALVIAEIWVVIAVGGAIGAGPTVVLLLLGSLLGVWLVRREGAKTFRALQLALNNRRAPQKEIADGVLIFLGGMFMILPGFISDVLGLLCLLPPTRALVRRFVFGAVAGRVATRTGAPVRVRARRTGTVDSGATAYRPAHPVIEGEIDPR